MKDFLGIPRTAVEVFNLLPEGTLCEVIGNALYMLPIPTTTHQRVLLDIFTDIYHYLKLNNLGEVLTIPFDVYLNEETIVVPDILFIKQGNAGILQENGVHGSPGVIIEILLDNASHDQELKLEIYQRNGVPEYIIIDPETKQVWHYLLNDQQYVAQSTIESGKLFIKQLDLTITF